MAADFVFRTVWRAPGTPVEVATVLADAEALPRWWPSVYLAVDVLATPDTETGNGAVARLHTTGWLPYTLTWTLTITSPITAEGFTLSAEGDLEGTGVWTFREVGPETEVVYDWRVRAGKPLLRRTSWLLRPAFAANHTWAMRKGEQSLALELRRRRGEQVPPPPRATFR